MIRQQDDDRIVLIMESDADISIVEGHVVESRVRLAPGHGKLASLDAARLHREAGHAWAVCFVDGDFASQVDIDEVNVFCTNYYDLDAEVFFVCPELLERFLSTHRRAGEKASALSARKQILQMATAVGAVRAVIVTQGFQVSVARFPMHELNKREHGNTHLARAVTIAVGRAKSSDAVATAIRDASDELLQSGVGEDMLCNGHDLLGAMAVVIAKIGDLRPRPAELAASFRASVGCECFKRVSVYSKLSNWAAQQGENNFWSCPSSIAVQ